MTNAAPLDVFKTTHTEEQSVIATERCDNDKLKRIVELLIQLDNERLKAEEKGEQ